MTQHQDDDVHDRTHRLAKLLGVAPDSVQLLAGRQVVLELGADAATTEVGRLAFLTLCNLATRLGPYLPNLDFAVPENTPAITSPVYRVSASLAAQAEWILSAAIPIDNLVRRAADPSQTYDVAVAVGTGTIVARTRLRVGWQGWLGVVSAGAEDVPIDSGTNSFGGLVAAAMATARLHALQIAAIGVAIPPTTMSWRLNALTLATEAGGPELPASVTLPRALLVGAGALGSAFSYAMTHVPGLHGAVDAVDSDVLKPTNANRQITAPFDRARDANTLKVDDLATAWPVLQPFPIKYDEFKTKHGRSANDYEIVVTAVDNTDARRDVAKDLPKSIIDGATGGLTVAVMRGEDPTVSCVACAYAEIMTDQDALWSRQLGTSRERVEQLRNGTLAFTEAVIHDIRETGTLSLDHKDEEALRDEGWSYLERARCGNAKPDRDLPSASVSYVSAICGFLMAAQVIAESLGVPTFEGERSQWIWEDVLRTPPQQGQRSAADRSRSCAERHKLRSRIYRRKWHLGGGD